MFTINEAALCVCVCFLLCGTSLTAPPETLRQVNVLYRHGDRSPTAIYPLDINKESVAWPDGLGWLTNIGKNQQYQLGQYLKGRYDGFLNTSHYNHNEILIQSSGVERCLMSAYCNLAGLFPPQGSQIWKADLLWQPIPVQTKPVDTDNMLAETAPCPRYDQLKQEAFDSPEVKKEEEENKEFYEMVTAKTGVNKETLEDIWEVVDTLVCERAHNLTWNDWVTPAVWAKLDAMLTMSFDTLFATPEMSKLKGGPLLKQIISNLDSGSLPGAQLPKFYMYSAHDVTVASLLSALNVYNSHQPIYRALVIIELHEVNNVSEVQILYKNETDREPYTLIVPGCDSSCSLDKFKALTQASIPGNWTEECVAKSTFNPSSDLSPASWIALTVGIGLCIAVAIAVIVMTVKMHKKRALNYTKI
jgi:hypothetical protein